MLIYSCGETILYTFPIAPRNLKLSEQLREIINRMEESDRKTKQLIEESHSRMRKLLSELDQPVTELE